MFGNKIKHFFKPTKKLRASSKIGQPTPQRKEIAGDDKRRMKREDYQISIVVYACTILISTKSKSIINFSRFVIKTVIKSTRASCVEIPTVLIFRENFVRLTKTTNKKNEKQKQQC